MTWIFSKCCLPSLLLTLAFFLLPPSAAAGSLTDFFVGQDEAVLSVWIAGSAENVGSGTLSRDGQVIRSFALPGDYKVTESGLTRGATYTYTLESTVPGPGTTTTTIQVIAGDIHGTLEKSMVWDAAFPAWNISNRGLIIASGHTITATAGAIIDGSKAQSGYRSIGLQGSAAFNVDGATIKNLSVLGHPVTGNSGVASFLNSTLQSFTVNVQTLNGINQLHSNSGSGVTVNFNNDQALNAISLRGIVNIDQLRLSLALLNDPATIDISANANLLTAMVAPASGRASLNAKVTIANNQFIGVSGYYGTLGVRAVTGAILIAGNEGGAAYSLSDLPVDDQGNGPQVRNNTGILSLKLFNVSHARIEDNAIAEGLDYGVWIASGRHNVVRNNTIDCLVAGNNTLPSIGIHAGKASAGESSVDVSDNQIIGNTVKGWYRTAISLASDANLVRDNIIQNYGNGVVVGGIGADSAPVTVSANHIFNNRFESILISGAQHAKVLCSGCDNPFFTAKTAAMNVLGGPFLGGNYWKDYAGIDSDNDWIGDSPYHTPHGIEDALPLLYDIVVTTATDEPDANLADGKCDTALTTAEEQCSLRAAVMEANLRSGEHFIAFRIPSAATPSIELQSPLPAIDKALTINGMTQTGGWVRLNGARANADCGLTITAGSSTVKGLVIGNFWSEAGAGVSGHALCLAGGSGHLIEGNSIGTNGTTELPNHGNGIHITGATGSIIRGNVVAGNKNGIWIESDGNRVTGNFLGPNQLGTKVFGNQGSGVHVYAGGGNIIGGATAPEKNIISGNLEGVWVDFGKDLPNTIIGNFIGVDNEGKAFLGNTNGVGHIDTDLSGKWIYRQKVGILLRESPGTIVKDNVVSGNGEGVALTGKKTTGTVVQGNRIGTDASGMHGIGNSADGILIAAGGGNIVGGNGAKDGNIISDNKWHAIRIGASSDLLPFRPPSPDAGHNLIQGNHLGVDATGMLSLGNEQTGILIVDSPANVIGGPGTGEGNVIANNKQGGIFIIPLTQWANARNTVIQGNLIGLSKDGRLPLGNGNVGISVGPTQTDGTQIGGIGAGLGNVISANDGDGITLHGWNNLVQGNSIGTNQAGTDAVANTGNGITLSTGGSRLNDTDVNTIGGNTPGAGNLISGNQGCGILIEEGRHISVQGNAIGVRADGVSPLANALHGIYLKGGLSGENMIGGTSSAGNLVAHNGGHGILVGAGARNSILGNAIFQNALNGIKLNEFYGPLLYNDEQDTDSGANSGQNTPLLLSVLGQGGSTTIRGQLHSAPNGDYQIELFANSQPDLDGGAYEGETFLAALTVRTDSAGNGQFQTTVPGTASHVTATATDAQGNTSAFSPELIIVDSSADLADSNLADGTCDVGNGQCTLRAAIEETNHRHQPGIITFALPAHSAPVIDLTSPLPQLSTQVRIDGAGPSGAGRVEIRGGGAGSGAAGLVAMVKGTEINNMTIRGFAGNGIQMMNGQPTLTTLRLARVEILDNGGAGIKGAPDTHLNMSDCTIAGNGAGGVVNGHWIDAARIEVTLNKKGTSSATEAGDGIHTKLLRMSASTINNNEGDGVDGGYLLISGESILRDNGGFGVNAFIDSGLLSRITDTQVLFNGSGGIYAKLLSAERVVAAGNRKGGRLGPEAGDGIYADTVAHLDNSSVSNNEGDGVQALHYLAMDGSIIQNNLEYGIIYTSTWPLRMSSNKVLRNGRGGISGGAVLIAGALEVNDNGEFGIRARQVRITSGTICGNANYGIIASAIGLDGVTVCANKVAGVILYNYSSPQEVGSSGRIAQEAPAPMTLSNSVITANQGDGIVFAGETPLSITASNIFANSGLAVDNRSQALAVTARDNWWGDQGPVSGSFNGTVDTAEARTQAVTLVVTKKEDLAGLRGAVGQAVFSVSNFSQSEGGFTLTATDDLGWSITPPVMSKTIGPGATEEVALSVAVPFAAQTTVANTVTLSAALASNPTVSATAGLLVAVKGLLINEIDPEDGWVELFNPGPADLALAGWRIASADGNLELAFPAHSTIPGGGYLVLHLSPADRTDSQGLDLYAAAEQRLPENDGSLLLLSPDGTAIDFLRYGDSTELVFSCNN